MRLLRAVWTRLDVATRSYTAFCFGAHLATGLRYRMADGMVQVLRTGVRCAHCCALHTSDANLTEHMARKHPNVGLPVGHASPTLAAVGDKRVVREAHPKRGMRVPGTLLNTNIERAHKSGVDSFRPPQRVSAKKLSSMEMATNAKDAQGSSLKQRSADAQEHQCRECKDSFYSARLLRLHERLVHTTAFPHHCLHCGRGFGLVHDLNRHINDEHARAGESGETREGWESREGKCHRFTCLKCPSTSYPTETQLRLHARLVHKATFPNLARE